MSKKLWKVHAQQLRLTNPSTKAWQYAEPGEVLEEVTTAGAAGPGEVRIFRTKEPGIQGYIVSFTALDADATLLS
jgi:hypothetical protein